MKKELKLDILHLISKLEAILRKGFSRDILAGNYQSVYKGKGMEFVGFREYDTTDDALLIDWKASLKAHKMMVRVLEEERNLTTFFLLDVSESMLFSSHKKLKCEYAAEFVATLAYAISGVGDNIGLAMFNEKVMYFIPPGIGKNQFYNMLRALKNVDHYGGKFDLNSALEYLFALNILKQDTVVFLVSDYIGLKPGWEKSIKLAGLKFDLTSVVIRDPVDLHLPAVSADVHLGDPFSQRQMLVNPREVKTEYDREAKMQIERLKKELQKTQSSLLVLETNKPFLTELFSFFRYRQRYK